jgi:hypothetical protein
MSLCEPITVPNAWEAHEHLAFVTFDVESRPIVPHGRERSLEGSPCARHASSGRRRTSQGSVRITRRVARCRGASPVRCSTVKAMDTGRWHPLGGLVNHSGGNSRRGGFSLFFLPTANDQSPPPTTASPPYYQDASAWGIRSLGPLSLSFCKRSDFLKLL